MVAAQPAAAHDLALAPPSAGNRFRQRKISTKQTLQIFKQSQISDVDNADLQQRDLQEIETGVEKNEEEEVHLKKILNSTGISSTSDAYIPTPDASQKWPDAGKYYKGRFHQPLSYIKSSCQVEEYVGCIYYMDEEDNQFLEKFNNELGAKKVDLLSDDEFEILMERFEKIISEKQPFLVTDPSQMLSLNEIRVALLKTEKTSARDIYKQLSTDLSVQPFVTLLDENTSKKVRPISVLLDAYGDEIYKHFKDRKIKRNGQPIIASLKFTGEDDNDAYICFRQRQFRQQRKTRRADTQSSDKLIKLYQELRHTRDLVFLVAQRELKRLEALQTEREIFELRCKVKTNKRDLGINDSDEDLIAHKKKKPISTPAAVEESVVQSAGKKDKKALSKTGNNANTQQEKFKNASQDLAGSDSPQQFQPYVKLPPSKIPDMELETVQHVLKNKDVGMQKFVEEKLKKRSLADIGYINLTDDGYCPLFDVSAPNQNILDVSHIPYSSITSSFFDIQSLGYIPNIHKYIEKGITDNEKDSLLINLNENPKKKRKIEKFVPESYNPLYQKHVNTSDPVLTLRKRVGRCGITYIDRKSMIKKPEEDKIFEETDQDIESLEQKERFEDRWKYDNDLNYLDIENEPFSDDPSKLNSISNDTQVIRFGGMLLSKAYETLKEAIIHQRQQVYYQQLQRLQQHRAVQQQLQQQQKTSTQTNSDQRQGSQGRSNSNQINGAGSLQSPNPSTASINKHGVNRVNNSKSPIKTEN